DCATYSLPMLVPAPPLFSMTTCWPHILESFSASMRATISVGPPAATGTMRRTGFIREIGLLRARRAREKIGRECRRSAEGNQATTGEHGDTPVVSMLPPYAAARLTYSAKGRACRLFPAPTEYPIDLRLR